jgi:lipopolysaccharide transport system permease protein
MLGNHVGPPLRFSTSRRRPTWQAGQENDGIAMRQYLIELWQHRDLTWSFALRDIKARYKQTALGAAWAVLQPFSLMVVFTLVFSRFARVSSDGLPYPIFSYTGLIFWSFFSVTVAQGTVAIGANASLVRKIYFPRETLLISIIMSAALDLAIAAVIFAGMLAYYRITITWTILWLPVLLMVQTFFALGVICISSAVQAHYRDVGHALPLVLQMLMFATPVAYPLSAVPEGLLSFYVLNPMTPVIDGYRRVVLHGQSPDMPSLSTAAGVTLVLVLLGYSIFKRAEGTFADVI